MNVTIIIPTLNACEHTDACLRSLHQTYKCRFRFVVFDNGSTDETAKVLEKYPLVASYRSTWNMGFAAGCNAAVRLETTRRATGPFRNGINPDVFVFLNNDTILFPGWLDELLAPFEDPEVGAVGPMSNWVSGEQLIPAGPWRAAEGEDEDLAAGAEVWMHDWKGGVTETKRLVGFCMAVRASAFREVGGFDEQFEIGGCEDDDLCKSLTKAGYKLMIARGCFVYHVGHVTFNENGIDYMSQEFINQQKFAAKWGGEFAGPMQP